MRGQGVADWELIELIVQFWNEDWLNNRRVAEMEEKLDTLMAILKGQQQIQMSSASVETPPIASPQQISGASKEIMDLLDNHGTHPPPPPPPEEEEQERTATATSQHPSFDPDSINFRVKHEYQLRF